MPKLPVVSGKQAIKAFSKIGYQIVRQQGSHIRLRHLDSFHFRPFTIPIHRELKPGLLNKLISDANLSRDEFIKLLQK